MAENKHNFDGIGKATATLIMTVMATGPLAFLTRGFLGKITFFFLKKVGSSFANQGLAILNLGVDVLKTAQDKRTFDREIEAALKKVQTANRRLTKKEQDEIDEPVRMAFRKFARFV